MIRGKQENGHVKSVNYVTDIVREGDPIRRKENLAKLIAERTPAEVLVLTAISVLSEDAMIRRAALERLDECNRDEGNTAARVIVLLQSWKADGALLTWPNAMDANQTSRALQIEAAYRSRSPLSSVVNRGHQEVSAQLIAGGAHLNLTQSGAANALFAASQNGQESIVRELTDSGAAVNMFTDDGETALMAASKGGNARITKLLLGAGADVSLQNKHGCTALFLASSRGRNEVVQLLVAASAAEADVKDIQGDTPLAIALERGHLRVAEILVEVKADINAKNRDGETPLMIASRKGRLEAVRFLVKNGALLDNRNPDGETAFELARQSQHAEVEAFLRGSGASGAGVASPKPWWQFWG